MNDGEFRDVVSRLNGLCATVESGFAEIKTELRHAEKTSVVMRGMSTAVVVLAGLSMLLSGYAITTANSNRDLIVELVRQTNSQAHQIEQSVQDIGQVQKQIEKNDPLPPR